MEELKIVLSWADYVTKKYVSQCLCNCYAYLKSSQHSWCTDDIKLFVQQIFRMQIPNCDIFFQMAMDQTSVECNIIDALLDRGFEMIILDIFQCLYGSDLCNARVTCKRWNEFISHWIFNKEKNHNRLLEKMQEKMFSDSPAIRKEIDTSSEIFDIRCDNTDIMVGTCDGQVFAFDRKTMEEKNHNGELHDGSVQLSYNAEYIFTAGEDGLLGVIYRKSFENVQTLFGTDDSHYMQPSLWGISCHQDTVITGAGNGEINVLKFGAKMKITNNGHSVKVLEKVKTLDHHRESVSHIEFDGTHLLSGSSDKTMKLIDIHSGEILKNMKTEHMVLCVDMSYPYAVSCSSLERGGNGIKMWNLRCHSDEPFRVFDLCDTLDLRMSKKLMIASFNHLSLHKVRTIQLCLILGLLILPFSPQKLTRSTNRQHSEFLNNLPAYERPQGSDASSEEDSADSDSSLEDHEFPYGAVVMAWKLADLIKEDVPSLNLPKVAWKTTYNDACAVFIDDSTVIYSDMCKIVYRNFWM